MYNSRSLFQNIIDTAFSLRYIYRECIFDEKNKVLCIHIPKCASTSLQYLMLTYMGELPDELPEGNRFRLIKDTVLRNSLKGKSRNMINAFFVIRNSNVFSVMRDPIKRFISAHKMMNASPSYKREIEKRLGIPLNQENHVDDLINYLHRARLPDWHFRPQSAFLRAVPNITVVPMDAAKIQKTLSDFGHSGDWGDAFGKTVKNRSQSSNIEISSQQLAKLTDFYRPDYELAEKHGIELF